MTVVAMAACADDSGIGGGENNEQTLPETLSVSATSVNFATEGGIYRITITAATDWIAALTNNRADDWCSISATTGGAGSSTITITTTANEDPEDRSATLVVKSGEESATITINQKYKDAILVTSAKYMADAVGGEVAVEVKANIDFQYTIDDAANEWISYLDTRALQSHTLVFAVAENTSKAKREGKITFSSGDLKEEVVIYQVGSEPVIVLSQNSFDVSGLGGVVTVEVASNVDVEVEIPDDVDWVSENTSRALSTNTYYFNVVANEDPDRRMAIIKFTNKANYLEETVVIKQAGKESVAIADRSCEVADQGGTSDVEFVASEPWSISLASTRANDWCNIEPMSGDAGDAEVTVTTTPNTTGETRSVDVTIKAGEGARTFTVVQYAASNTKDDRTALMAIFNAIDTSNWPTNHNWGTDKPLKDWRGVRVDDNGFVDRIILPESTSKASSVIPVSGFSALKLFQITVGGNVSHVRVENNPSLERVSIVYNNLKQLEIANCPRLREIKCDRNQLTSLDVSKCVNLESLRCEDNQLTSLDIFNSSKLVELSCDINQLTSIDLSKCDGLKTLACTNNKLTSLDVSDCVELEALWCCDNQLTSLDVSNCNDITKVELRGNQLTSLNASGLTKLSELDCSANPLVSLNTNGCVALTQLRLENNKLTSLDVSGCALLQALNCTNMQLTSLNVGGCVALRELRCYENQLTSLNVGGCVALQILDCYNNQLTSLDVSGCVALRELRCYENQLTSLNVGGCVALQILDCRDNLLPSLDVSDCVALHELFCYSNQLTSLDVSGCVSLQQLSCFNNQLTSLDVSKNSELKNLDTSFNWDLKYIYICPGQTFEELKIDYHTQLVTTS